MDFFVYIQIINNKKMKTEEFCNSLSETEKNIIINELHERNIGVRILDNTSLFYIKAKEYAIVSKIKEITAQNSIESMIYWQLTLEELKKHNLR